ncbi:hypothetical protein Tco_0547688 [Tanacetum coccineum]
MFLPGYTSALQIADVFGSAWFHMILPGYTSALQIADVFGFLVTCLLYRLQMCLVPHDSPGYTSALQITDVFGCLIADVFGSGSALVCMHLFGLLRIETSYSTESALFVFVF